MVLVPCAGWLMLLFWKCPSKLVTSWLKGSHKNTGKMGHMLIPETGPPPVYADLAFSSLSVSSKDKHFISPMFDNEG